MCLSSQFMLRNINSLPVTCCLERVRYSLGWNVPFKHGMERTLPAWVGTYHSSLGWNLPLQPGLERTIPAWVGRYHSRLGCVFVSLAVYVAVGTLCLEILYSAFGAE